MPAEGRFRVTHLLTCLSLWFLPVVHACFLLSSYLPKLAIALQDVSSESPFSSYFFFCISGVSDAPV